MSFNQDFNFSEQVHKQIAIPKIYQPNGFEKIESNLHDKLDMGYGIDYTAWYKERKITIQERFRRSKYKHYRDVTLRYRRPFNRNQNRIKSEYFKINASHFLYGIVNSQHNDFIWAVLYDVHQLIKAISDKDIDFTSKLNRDNSSSFLIIKIADLNKIGAIEVAYNL